MEEIFPDSEVRSILIKVAAKGGGSSEQLANWITTPPRFSVLRLNTLLHDKDEIIEQVQKHLEEQYKGRDLIPRVFLHPVLEDVLVVQSLGSNLHRSGQQAEESEVIVGLICGCAVLRGANVFAPGVMGMSTNVVIGDRVSVYADVHGKCRKGFSQKFTGSRKIFLGNGKALMSRSDVFNFGGAVSGVAIELTDRVFDCPSFNDLAARGLLMLQNLPSIVAGNALVTPGEGSTVLDMCAAPGGKTTLLAHLVGPQGRVIAFDKSKNKIAQIEGNCARLGLSDRVSAFVQDGTKCVQAEPGGENTGKPPFPPNSFSRILLDAPCSGLGQRPQLLNKIISKELASFARLQRKLFHSAVRLLQPGGILVYSTCTMVEEENEGVVAWVLDQFPEMKLVAVDPRVGGPGWEVQGLTAEQAGKTRRFFGPFEIEAGREDSDTIGFFMAKFVKEQS